jgi:hypothetical protein
LFPVAKLCSVALSWLMAFAVQNQAVSVCACVRMLPVEAPNSLVSSRSVAYRALVNAGGGGARNCEVLSSMNGSIAASHGVWAICREGAGGQTHTPACTGSVGAPRPGGDGPFRPSFTRSATMSAEAASPTAIPRAVFLSFGSAAIDAWYLASRAPPESPRYATRVLYAAAITAASIDALPAPTEKWWYGTYRCPILVAAS